jgi:hypothetical protein
MSPLPLLTLRPLSRQTFKLPNTLVRDNINLTLRLAIIYTGTPALAAVAKFAPTL